MKINLPVSNHENDYPESINIISTTDLKGKVTYVNNDFVKVSGYSADELLGQNHNIVRHPDVPPAAFADLWSTLKKGRSWMGLVKNRCKDGSYYWVDAYVTPIGKRGNIHEYQSVRSKPDRTLVRRAERLYKNLLNGKVPLVLRLPKLSIQAKLATGFVLAAVPAWLLLLMGSTENMVLILLVLILGIVASIITTVTLADRIAKTAHDAREIIENPLMQYVYTNSTDDIGVTELALKMRSSELRAVVARIADSGNNLEKTIGFLVNTIKETSSRVLAQQTETDQVAAAMNQMSATVQEVARNTAHAATATCEAHQSANSGQAVVNRTIGSIRDVAHSVEQASVVINQLNSDADNITRIVQVIRSIADQTNLLALNAAIEAARAGEKGRGFSVVADEVRTLALRTRNSTKEIRDMVEQLQARSSEAVMAMEQGRIRTESCVECATQAGDMLVKITNAVSIVNDVNTQIATAAEEQSAVAEEINRNVGKISELASANADGARRTMEISHQLSAETARQKELVNQFA